ncbi:uncharacterized protein G2W53_010654 [Senna tora]|uniref:Uncharacterized protein n=1 Tax=Senna tora TaxID=362788 RepID=A0A834X184_9FABA|nr:uncharacterized protein G2W53_010654 [Senna tora]
MVAHSMVKPKGNGRSKNTQREQRVLTNVTNTVISKEGRMKPIKDAMVTVSHSQRSVGLQTETTRYKDEYGDERRLEGGAIAGYES